MPIPLTITPATVTPTTLSQAVVEGWPLLCSDSLPCSAFLLCSESGIGASAVVPLTISPAS